MSNWPDEWSKMKIECDRLERAIQEALAILLQLRHTASYYGDRGYGQQAKDASKVLESALARAAAPE